MTGTRDKDDKLTLMLASPAHGIETRLSEKVEKARILIFCFLCLLSCLLL